METETNLISNLVIGKGEVGTALASILECDSYDLGEENNNEYEVIHIAFPYSLNFHSYVQEYREKFKAKHVVIHSTVPVGTSRKLNATHSPIRGVHPHLEDGIRTFVKYFAGENAQGMANIFREHGVNCEWTYEPETTELMKLVDTSTYGLNILIEKEIKRLCEKYGADFAWVYKDANKTYNEGYEKLGMPQYKKYNLEHREGKIGGHCIMQNAGLLDTWINETLKEKNARL